MILNLNNYSLYCFNFNFNGISIILLEFFKNILLMRGVGRMAPLGKQTLDKGLKSLSNRGGSFGNDPKKPDDDKKEQKNENESETGISDSKNSSPKIFSNTLPSNSSSPNLDFPVRNYHHSAFREGFDYDAVIDDANASKNIEEELKARNPSNKSHLIVASQTKEEDIMKTVEAIDNGTEIHQKQADDLKQVVDHYIKDVVPPIISNELSLEQQTAIVKTVKDNDPALIEQTFSDVVSLTAILTSSSDVPVLDDVNRPFTDNYGNIVTQPTIFIDNINYSNQNKEQNVQPLNNVVDNVDEQKLKSHAVEHPKGSKFVQNNKDSFDQIVDKSLGSYIPLTTTSIPSTSSTSISTTTSTSTTTIISTPTTTSISPKPIVFNNNNDNND
jgi:flagellar biosynthesis regulator FlaF